MFRNELVQAYRMVADTREAAPADKVKRLGSAPVIISVAASGARIEIAAAEGRRKRALGPFATAATDTATDDRASHPAGRHAATPAEPDGLSGRS
ncbi:MAG: hypothetical protein M3Y33_00715 [Actinomycetota bacterium]|nr:hypothetical protein [Actinomycetota bacterium]